MDSHNDFRWKVWFFALTFCLSAVFFSCVTAAIADYKEGELIIRYKAGVNASTASVGTVASAKVKREISQIRSKRIKLPKGISVEDAIAKYKKDPAIEYVGPNHIIHICTEPNDEYYLDPWLYWYWQWGLYSDIYPNAGIQAPDAWDITTGSSDVIIAIVDTGVYTNHEDLAGKIVTGRNFVTGASDPTNANDDNGHGTFTAGIAAAQTNNTIGVAGVSWGARIMPIKVMDADGYGLESDAAEGIIWAADNGAKIISMSMGGYDDVPAEQAAIEYAYNKGCVLVAASGNDGLSTSFYPASYDQVIAVGASNENRQRCTENDWGAGGSNYGEYLDVMAPGNEIMSTWWDEGGSTYNIASGTSAAAPFVAGIASLIWSLHPSWSNGEVVEQIKLSCRDIGTTGWDQYTGWGLVNAYHALVDPPLASSKISDLSTKSSGTLVKVEDAVITSGSDQLSDRMYIEQNDRTSAIMLPFTTVPSGYSEGDIVQVIGTLMTQNGERVIQGASLSESGTQTPLKPFLMQTKAVGGGTLGLKPGVDNGFGLNNVSLLITICGKVTATGWTYFYVDDGSNLEDGSGFTGVKVICGSLTKPAKDDYVRITGISSVEQPEGLEIYVPVIRVRKQDDIQSMQ
ncbi:S8 family peptidase [bacterium]|nr:S8 family peptidase [bacterium]